MILTEAEYKLERQITNHTPYLAITGELWGVFCEDSVKIERVITTPHCNIYPCFFFIYHPSNPKRNRGRYQHISIQCRRYRLTLGHYVGLVWRVSQCVHIYCIQLPWTPVRFDLHAVLRFNTSPGQPDMHFIIIPKFHGPLSSHERKKKGWGLSTWILLTDKPAWTKITSIGAWSAANRSLSNQSWPNTSSLFMHHSCPLRLSSQSHLCVTSLGKFISPGANEALKIEPMVYLIDYLAGTYHLSCWFFLITGLLHVWSNYTTECVLRWRWQSQWIS